MNDPLEPESLRATPFSDLANVRREIELLNRVIRLLLIGLTIATAGLCLFLYRQSQLLRFQILAQQAAVIEADKQQAPILAVLPIFQRIGGRHPDYASNVLKKFNLPVMLPTNTPASGQK